MKNEILNAVINVRDALDDVKKYWTCPNVNDLTKCECDNCRYRVICDLDFDIRRDLNTLYYAFTDL